MLVSRQAILFYLLLGHALHRRVVRRLVVNVIR